MPGRAMCPKARVRCRLWVVLGLAALLVLEGGASGSGRAVPGGHPFLQIFAVFGRDDSVEVSFRAETVPGESATTTADTVAEDLVQSGWEAGVARRDALIALNARYRSPGDPSRDAVEVEFPGPLAAPGSYLRCSSRDYFVCTVWEFQLSYVPSGALVLGLRDPEGSAGGEATVAVTLELPGRVLGTDAEARSGRAMYWELDWTPGAAMNAGGRSIWVNPKVAGLVLALMAVTGLGGWLLFDELRRSRRARHSSKGRRQAVRNR